MEGLNETQMQQVAAAIEQSKEANNNIIGKFLKDADDKLAKMEEVAQALFTEVATQTKRVDERVVDLNLLKDIALSQTSNLNDRSLEIEQKLLAIEKKFIEADVQHSDLITNLGEFGEKQTTALSALRANIDLWANGFQARIESQVGGLGGMQGSAGGAEKEKKGPRVDRKEVAVWKLPDNVGKDGFRHWIDAVDNQLEAVHSLPFPELVLERVRRSKVEVGKVEFEKILEDVMHDNDTVEVDLAASWQFVEKSRILHTYFTAKINTELHGKCISITNKHGFEMYRRICEAVDAVP